MCQNVLFIFQFQKISPGATRTSVPLPDLSQHAMAQVPGMLVATIAPLIKDLPRLWAACEHDKWGAQVASDLMG